MTASFDGEGRTWSHGSAATRPEQEPTGWIGPDGSGSTGSAPAGRFRVSR